MTKTTCACGSSHSRIHEPNVKMTGRSAKMTMTAPFIRTSEAT